MSLVGTVIAVDGEWITVEVRPLVGCQGCRACGGLLSGNEATQFRRVSALRQGFALAPGDRVTLDTRPGEVTLAALVMFGLPLVGLFLGLWAGPTLLAQPGSATPAADWHHAIGGVVGLVTAACLVYLGARAGWFTHLSLKVTGKLPSTAIPSDSYCTNVHYP